jgi:Na+/melibiose symporter-like transporter
MSNENSENQDNRQKRYPYLKRWIMGLCIFSAIGFLYNEVYSGWFSSYTVFIFGLEYKDWARIAATSSILGAVLYLLYGVISDNLRTKLGRRIPLILVVRFQRYLGVFYIQLAIFYSGSLSMQV